MKGVWNKTSIIILIENSEIKSDRDYIMMEPTIIYSIQDPFKQSVHNNIFQEVTQVLVSYIF